MDCSSCRFSSPQVTNDDDDVVLLCRRFPPVATPIRVTDDGLTEYILWPTVRAQDWCGEYLPTADE